MPSPDPVDKPAPLHREESTTPDLVERWRQAAEAADRRDFDTTMGVYASDAAWEVQPLGISHRVAPAIRSFLEDWLGSYEDSEYDQDRVTTSATGSCLW